MTNSDTPVVLELFQPEFNLFRLATRRDINLKSEARKSWDIVATNYEPELDLALPLWPAE